VVAAFTNGEDVRSGLRQGLHARVTAAETGVEDRAAVGRQQLPVHLAEAGLILHVKVNLLACCRSERVKMKPARSADCTGEHITDLDRRGAAAVVAEEVEKHEGRFTRRRTNPCRGAGFASSCIESKCSEWLSTRDQGNEEITTRIRHTGKGDWRTIGKD